MLLFWVVTPCRLVGRYQRSALKMETVCFYETLVSTYESTKNHNPQQHYLNFWLEKSSKRMPLVIPSHRQIERKQYYYPFEVEARLNNI
jgi:hypothetical protein